MSPKGSDLDYVPTALVLELEKKKQFPVVHQSQPKGYDVAIDRQRVLRPGTDRAHRPASGRASSTMPGRAPSNGW